MTKQQPGADDSSDRPALIEITPAMIEAGVSEWRELCFGEGAARIVEAIYLAMEIERRG